jgi:DNA-binding beta-propeller fold protein YncE
LQRYDARGELNWSIGIEGLGSDVMVSADPVGGGAWVSTSAGITRVDKRGTVLWGPVDFGGTAGPWGVAVDTSDGSAFATAYAGDRVFKVEPTGDVRWQIELDEPGAPMFSPLDHGAYIGTHDYWHDTVKLSRSGRVEWVKNVPPSPYTYGRAVNPVDGSLYVVSGWASYLVNVSRTGRVMADVYLGNEWGPLANQGIEVSLDGRSLYTANSASEVGIDSYSVSSDHLTSRWHFDPGWYETSTDAYAPYYRPFVGMPRVP